MELPKDYDCMILYHLRKANVIANILSKKSMGRLTYIAKVRRLQISGIHDRKASGIKFEMKETNLLLSYVNLYSSLGLHKFETCSYARW